MVVVDVDVVVRVGGGVVVVGVDVVVRGGSNGLCAFMQFRPSLFDDLDESLMRDMVMDMSLL